jgi:hypothetical protein
MDWDLEEDGEKERDVGRSTSLHVSASCAMIGQNVACLKKERGVAGRHREREQGRKGRKSREEKKKERCNYRIRKVKKKRSDNWGKVAQRMT